MDEGLVSEWLRPSVGNNFGLRRAGTVCLFMLLMFTLQVQESHGFSLRVEETFRETRIKTPDPIYFIRDNVRTKQLTEIGDSPFVRFDESYDHVAMEWQRLPNETMDFEMSFTSGNTSVLDIPTTNILTSGCISSTMFMAFRMNLMCTGEYAATVPFTAVLNYSILQYPLNVLNFEVDLNSTQCSATENRLTGGAYLMYQNFARRGSAVLKMNKICGLREAESTQIETQTLIGIIAGSIGGVLVIVIVIILVISNRRAHRKAKRLEEDMEKTRADGLKAIGDRLSLVTSSFNPQYASTSPNLLYGGSFMSQPYQGQEGHYTQQVDVRLLMEQLLLKMRENVSGALVERSAVHVGEEIGRGAFGRVCIGSLVLESDPEPIPCAIKTVKDVKAPSDVEEFLEEAIMLKDFRHKNVMSLHAIVMDTEDLPLVCLEFMHHGDLKSFLRKFRGSTGNLLDEYNQANFKLLLGFSAQVAEGMSYLASRNFVHRDLAARNCMLNKDLEVKIGDFGLARDIDADNYYRMGTARPLPVKWMAYESLQMQVFTVQTDIWSFGVVMWEIFSLGIQPYSGVANHEMLDVLKQGIRLSPPDQCPVEVYNIMKQCWLVNPDDRPTFDMLVQMLSDAGERLYENMPLHVTSDGTDYQNVSPGPPGSIVHQVSINANQSTRKSSNFSNNSVGGQYNLSMVPQRSHSFDKYEEMKPKSKGASTDPDQEKKTEIDTVDVVTSDESGSLSPPRSSNFKALNLRLTATTITAEVEEMNARNGDVAPGRSPATPSQSCNGKIVLNGSSDADTATTEGEDAEYTYQLPSNRRRTAGADDGEEVAARKARIRAQEAADMSEGSSSSV